jgi:predicted MFS family arabinose efflux permease
MVASAIAEAVEALASLRRLWASFFERVHGIPVAHAGLLVAIGAGLLAGAGSLASGFVADRLPDAVEWLRMPQVTLPVTAAACLLVAISQSTAGAIAAFLFASLLAPIFLAPSYKMLLSRVSPDAHGVALAGVQVATALVGSSLGPAIVGIVGGATGSLRIGLAMLVLAGLLATMHFWLASRSIGPGMARDVTEP